MKDRTRYSPEPADPQAYTVSFDRFYTRFAPLYNLFVKLFPVWRRWISHVLPYVKGPRILELSFGTGYLLNRYERCAELYAAEYNRRMIDLARRKLHGTGRSISFQQADASHLPFRSGVFDSVVNTMAFTGYPEGPRAMAEMNRVLKKGGKVVMVDVNYPSDGNRTGVTLARIWMALGDILRDMDALFCSAGFDYREEEIGGWGSVHLYIATKIKSLRDV